MNMIRSGIQSLTALIIAVVLAACFSSTALAGLTSSPLGAVGQQAPGSPGHVIVTR